MKACSSSAQKGHLFDVTSCHGLFLLGMSNPDDRSPAAGVAGRAAVSGQEPAQGQVWVRSTRRRRKRKVRVRGVLREDGAKSPIDTGVLRLFRGLTRQSEVL